MFSLFPFSPLPLSFVLFLLYFLFLLLPDLVLFLTLKHDFLSASTGPEIVPIVCPKHTNAQSILGEALGSLGPPHFFAHSSAQA